MTTKRIRLHSELGLSEREVMAFAMREYDGDFPELGDKIPEHWLGRVDAAIKALNDAGFIIIRRE